VELAQPGVSGWLHLLRLVPSDYLVTAGRAPHTAAMLQVALAVTVFLVVPGLARRDPAVPRHVLFSVAAVGLVAAVLSVVAVPVIYFTTGDWNEIDRYISVTRSRGAFHLKDVNAAGSQYILAALLSLALAPEGRGARLAWRVGQVAIVLALWMSGSRAAITAGALGVLVWAVIAWLAGRGLGMPRLSTRALGACALVVIVAMTGSVRLGSAQATKGSAILSLSIRGDFLRTSLDMMKTAPLTGVGIGTYYDRSSQFMPAALRAIYGRENAHNYFMQVGAEVGLIGLLAFLWWLGRALGAGWTRVREEGWRGLSFAAVCGCGVYLLTCVTGHPFLVVEAAVPFWAALGATAALGAEPEVLY
jgi:O-antigen ligase